MSEVHQVPHRSHRAGWLRAAVLGANDGIVSIASLIIGVAAAGSDQAACLLAGVAGLAAGAMSMAAGEYVSVFSQADAENADLEVERRSLEENYELEMRELAEIYERRGLDEDLAHKVAEQLMEHDALEAHARDDIGIVDLHRARPLQAAVYSAMAFTIGGGLPLLTTWLNTSVRLIPTVAALSLLALVGLGALAARVGGARVFPAAWRVGFWGAAAMALTAVVGRLFGVSV